MKIRRDFVTNSSSSNFIVSKSADQILPDEFKSEFEQLTSIDDIIDKLDTNYESGYMFHNIEESYIKAQYNLTDKQIGLLKAAVIGKIEEYDRIINLLDAGHQILYACVDWDSNLYNSELFSLLDTLNVIDREG